MRRLLVLPVLLLGLLAGCGDAEADALSKEEYIEQGDARCEELNEELEGIAEPESADDIAPALERMGGLFEDFRSDLAELEPPDDAEELHQDFLDTVDKAIETVDKAGTAAEDGDMETAQSEIEAMDE